MRCCRGHCCCMRQPLPWQYWALSSIPVSSLSLLLLFVSSLFHRVGCIEHDIMLERGHLGSGLTYVYMAGRADEPMVFVISQSCFCICLFFCLLSRPREQVRT